MMVEYLYDPCIMETLNQAKVIVLLDQTIENGYYQLVGGPNTVFEIRNGQAIGKEKSMSEAALLNHLR